MITRPLVVTSISVLTASRLSTVSKETSSSSAVQYREAVDKKDVDKATSIFAEDCVYENVIFEDAFVGKEAVKEYFSEVVEYLGDDVDFVIDDISEDPSGKVGLLWYFAPQVAHSTRLCDTRGTCRYLGSLFLSPGDGCSFIRLDEEGK